MDGVKKIKRDKIRGYFKNIGIEVPGDILAGDEFSFKDWQEVYDKMMGQQTSNMLQSVFNNYSGEGADRKMKPKDLQDFLTIHQEDSRQYSQEDIYNIILRHKKEVTSQKYEQ